jgi:ATP-dependent Clp protease ATP-binding subunit ClpC
MDANGRAIPFRHSYIVLTSNVGAEYLTRASLGFGNAASGFESLVKEQLKERFRPELLNRIDRIVVFKPLEEQALRSILRRELDETLRRLEEAQKVALSAGDDVLDWLMRRERASEEGARAARRLVEREVVSSLSTFLLEHPNKRKGQIKITKDQLRVA